MQSAQPTADTLKRTDENSIVGLRPNRSLSHPATATPAIDPTSAQPTYHPFAIASSRNCSPTAAIVPEMTAVSYPNRMPPNAATKERNAIFFIMTFRCSLSVASAPIRRAPRKRNNLDALSELT